MSRINKVSAEYFFTKSFTIIICNSKLRAMVEEILKGYIKSLAYWEPLKRQLKIVKETTFDIVLWYI